MSVLVFVESDGLEIKKSSQEAVAYSAALAKQTGGSVTAVFAGTFSADKLEQLGAYGATSVLQSSDSRLENAPIQALVSVAEAAVKQTAASIVVFPKSSVTDAVAPRLGARLKASVASNVVALPDTANGKFIVKRSIYTGKAFGYTQLDEPLKIIGIRKNAFEAVEEAGKKANVAPLDVTFLPTDFAVKHIATVKETTEVSLPEAEIVVSGGRGLKGPENWGIIEDLAHALGAATACSKPVSDLNWRPHHEHVGQTGIKVSPNLYFAIGISGAIQHVAGIASSKVIVAINTDPEAPIFKVADYGIVGNAFDVVPKLTAAVKASK